MMAALHTDQGRLLSIWIRVGDIMWSSSSFPKTSSHAFTLSWGMLKTCPEETRGHKVSGDPVSLFEGGAASAWADWKMMSSQTYPWERSEARSAGNLVPGKIIPLPKC